MTLLFQKSSEEFNVVLFYSLFKLIFSMCFYFYNGRRTRPYLLGHPVVISSHLVAIKVTIC